MKKAIFQLSMRCVVGVEKLTQEEIDKYTKRSCYKNEEKSENEQNSGKRKISSVCDIPNKKQKINTEEPAQSLCGYNQQNGSSFIGHKGNGDPGVVNTLPGFLNDNQSMAYGVLPSSEHNAAHNLPRSISYLQKIGITVSNIGANINSKSWSSATQDPAQLNRQHHFSALQSGESSGVINLNSSTHETHKKRGRPKLKKTDIEKHSFGLQNKPVKGKSSKPQDAQQTCEQSASLNVRHSNNNTVSQHIPVKEMNNNKVSVKSKSWDRNNLCNVPKKSYAAMHTGKLQARNKTSSSFSTLLNNGAVSLKPTEGNTHAVNLPSGVTLIQHGSQPSCGSKVTVPNGSKTGYHTFDRESIMHKKSFDRPTSVSNEHCNGKMIDFYENKPIHRNLSCGGAAVPHNTFHPENVQANQMSQSFDTNAGIINPVIKTETDTNNASFMHNVQENSKSAFDIPLPDFLRTSLDMPDISDAVSNCTVRQCGQVWKRSSSETYTANHFEPPPRRHSLDVCSDGLRHSAEHSTQQQKERANIRCSDPSQSQERLVPNILKKSSSQVQSENNVNLTSENTFVQSAQKVSKDLSLLASPYTDAKCVEEQERHTIMQSEKNSLQNCIVESIHVQSIDGGKPNKGTFKETKSMADNNLPRSKCVSRRHSASSSSSHSSRKEKIMLLFGESDEDIAIDPNCPSPEKIFRRISNKNFSIDDLTEVDFINSLPSVTDKAEGAKTCSDEQLTPENIKLDAGNLVQLELNSANIDKLFPSAADNEGDNSDKIQILPHQDDTISRRPVAVSSCENEQIAVDAESSETHPNSVLHCDVQPILNTTPKTLIGNNESSASNVNLLQLQHETAKSSENVTLEQVQHSPENSNVVSSSSLTTDKTADLNDSTQQFSDKPSQPDCNSTDTHKSNLTEAQLTSKDVAFSSHDSCVSTNETVSLKTAAHSQLQQISESSGSANYGSGLVQSQSELGRDVSNKVCDVTGNNSSNSDVSQVLEASKYNATEAHSVMDCNIPCEVLTNVNDVDTNEPSNVQVQQLERTVCTEMSFQDSSSNAQLLQDSENSLSESATETISSTISCSLINSNVTVSAVKQTIEGTLSSPCENSAITTLQSTGANRSPEIAQSLCTNTISSRKEGEILPNLSLKQEFDCDKSVKNGNGEAENIHSHTSDPTISTNAVEVVREAPVSVTMDDLIGVNPPVCNNSSNTHTQAQRVGANLKDFVEDSSRKTNPPVTDTAQSWPDQNQLCGSVTDDVILLDESNNETVSGKCVVDSASVKHSKTPAESNPSHVGTIRVRDVNSLVEPARASQSVLTSSVLKELTFLMYNMLSNRSRFNERSKAVQSLNSEYSKIEYDFALRDFRATACAQEIMFKDFVSKNKKVLSAFTRDLGIATLARIESEYGQKYSLKDLDDCLNQVHQLRIRREQRELQSAQGNKQVDNLVPGKVGSSRQWEISSTNNTSNPQYRPDVQQEPVNVVNKIHSNYGNYQMSSAMGHALQSQPQSSLVSTVNNSNVSEVPRRVSKNSVLGSLLVRESHRRKSQDAHVQLLGSKGSNSNQGVQQQRKIASSSAHTANEVSGTQGISNILQNQAVTEHTQQNLCSDQSPVGYRGQKEMYQGKGCRPAVDRTSVIHQASDLSQGNPVYGSNQMAVSTTGVRKEAACSLAYDQNGYAQQSTHNSVVINNQNMQTAALPNNSNVLNPVYISSEITVSGKNNQNVGQVIAPNANIPQPILIDQLQYTVNRYTTFAGTPSVHPSHSTVPTQQQAYQPSVAHQMQSACPSYSEAIQLRQSVPTNHMSYTQQFERSVGQPLQNSAALQPVNQSLHQLKTNQHLVSNDFYMSKYAGNSQSLPSNPYQPQETNHANMGHAQNTQDINRANMGHAQNNTYQQYMGTPSQQYNGVSNQQMHNFRQNVPQNSFHQSQTPNQQYARGNAPLSQEAIFAAYQLYKRGLAPPNVTLVSNSNNQVHRGNVQNVTENMKQADNGHSSGLAIQRNNVAESVKQVGYGQSAGPAIQRINFPENVKQVGYSQSAGPAIQRTSQSASPAVQRNSVAENVKQVGYGQSAGPTIQITVDQQQPVNPELQRVMHVSDTSKGVERSRKRMQHATQHVSLDQRSVYRPTNSNYAVNEHQAIQFNSSLMGLQQHQQPALAQSATSLQGQLNCASVSSPGFVHLPELPPPVEQIAAADNGLEDVVLVYDRTNEPRTVSRDSGYTTPSPRVATNANTNSADSSECHEGSEIIKTEEELRCVLCGKTARELCSACRSASYCSKQCQVKDWEDSHYAVCKNPNERGTTNVS